MKIIHCLILLLILCTGCQKHNDKQDMKLRINFQEGDLPSLHPHDLVIYLRGLSLSKAVFEPLTRINRSGEAELAGAESVEISPDQLRYTFKLRDQHWSDGTPVTAYHYENAWKAVVSPQSTCSRAELFYCIKNAERIKNKKAQLDMLGVKATDDKTLIIDLAYPSPYFLELTAQSIAVPLIEPENKQQTIFNGPFIVDEWKKGDFMRLKPNPYYWDNKHVHLKEIDIFFIEDVNTAFSLYEKKELDWIGVPLCPLSSELILHLKNEHKLRTQPIGRSFWIFLNTQNPVLGSTTLRQALSLAINRTAITNHILIGAEPSEKPLSYQLLPLTPPITLKESQAEAQKQFAIALQELDLTKDSFPPIEISYSQQANRKQVAEYLQEIWSQTFGIEVTLKAVEWNVLRSNLEKGLFVISMAYEGAFYKDPLELLERYATYNPSNFSQWLNLDFQNKISQARYEIDNSKRMMRLADAEQILIQQMPFIPICSDRLLFSHPPALTGYVIDSIGAIDFSRASFTHE